MNSIKRPLASARGRATLLFLCSLGIVLVYLLLARPDGSALGFDTQRSGSPVERIRADGGSAGDARSAGSSTLSTSTSSMSSASSSALQALSSFLGGHTLLTGSVTDQILEDPQESLAALIEEQEHSKIAQGASNCGEVEEEHVDPLPGNLTHRFHGACRSQYPPTVPNLQVRQIWKSPNMRKHTDVTLVTHLTLDQLPKLEFQCERWKSRVAAAVYVKIPHPKVKASRADADGGDDEGEGDGDGGVSHERLDDALVHETLVAAEQEVGAFFDKVHDAQMGCTLDIVLAYEEYVSNDPWLLLYPINAMRNRALQLADAENVLVVDVDTIPNVDLSHDLHIMSMYETLNRVLGNRQVIVLPTLTFPSTGEDDPLQTARWLSRSLEGIDRVKTMSDKGKIALHTTVRSPLMQQDMDLDRWLNASMPFRINDVHEDYEPVYLAKKATLPWYDERFRGLKLNRAVHTWHLHKSGFMFIVTPRAYVVHAPHPKGLLWLETRRSGHFKKIMRMLGQSHIDMEDDSYEPVTLFQCVSRRSNKWTWY